MRILLTGSTGQIGWELQRALDNRATVIAPARDQLNLADRDLIIAAVESARPDLIINAGGYTAVDRAESEPDLAEQINGIGPGILAERAAQHGAAFIHYSTDYVFDGSQSQPYAPDDTPAPINAYGRSKLLGERNVRAANDQSLVLRLSWVYGLRRRNFLLAMLEQAAQRDRLTVVDDQVGCPTPCTLVARWTTQIIDRALHDNNGRWSWNGAAGTYHLACAGRTSWCGFARRILELADLPKPVEVAAITTADYPTPARRPMQSVLNCDATTATFGIDFPDWDTALQQLMADYDTSAATSGLGHTGATAQGQRVP